MTCDYDCNLVKLEFLSCTNPVPSLGGKTCYEEKGEMQPLEWPDWPIRISKDKCDECKKEEAKIIKCPKDYKECKFFRHMLGDVDNTFTQCCLPDVTHLLPRGARIDGQCVVGNCLAYNSF